MDELHKRAYRHLIYWAMLDIRMLRNITYRPSRLFNPFTFRRELKNIGRAGTLADWLHNLAQFSVYEFEDFDEVRFWENYKTMCEEFDQPIDFRKIFERFIKDNHAEH